MSSPLFGDNVCRVVLLTSFILLNSLLLKLFSEVFWTLPKKHIFR